MLARVRTADQALIGSAMSDSVERFLAEATRCAAEGNEVNLSIREFIAHWGAQRRGYWFVQSILADLEKHNLATVPSFETGWIDSEIRLVPLKKGGLSTAIEGSSAAVSEDQATASGAGSVTVRVRSLRSALSDVCSVTPQDSLSRAQSLMLQGDYSQLPVLSDPRDLRGAISWESIAQARMNRPDARLRDCIVPADLVGVDDDLLIHIPKIIDSGFIFVRDSKRSICGVVTTADLSAAFLELAGPYLLIGEVERRLRVIAEQSFDLATIQSVRAPGDDGREVRGPEDLTVGEFVRLFESRDRWETLGWDVDRRVFIASISTLRDLRNEIMHFSPDPVEPDRVSAVRNLGKWLSLLQK